MYGGEIYYEYIGDSTGTPNHYMAYVKLYRRFVGGASLPSAISMNVISACGSNQIITMNRFLPPGVNSAGDGGYFPEIGECVNTGQGNLYKITIHSYKQDVVLPGACAHSLNVNLIGRTFSTNLNPYSGNLYLETTLINSIGDNSSPHFEQHPQIYQCLNQNVVSNFSAIEKDGDSVFYKLVPPQTTGGTVYGYQSGFSVSQPLSTNSGVFLDSLTGVMVYSPDVQQNSVVKVLVEEYRFDTSNSIWTRIGDTSRDVIFIVGSSCSGIASDFYLEKDSIGFDSLATTYCPDSVIRVKTNQPFLIASLSADGSDFNIVGDSGIAYPVAFTTYFDTVNSVYAKGVNIHLQQPISKNDTLIIHLQSGTDLNSLINHCGYEINLGDSVKITALDTCADVNPTGLFEVLANDGFELYPNPVVDNMTLKLNSGLKVKEIRVFSIEGNELLRKEDIASESEIRLDLSSLDRGTYLIQIKGEGGKLFSKLFVKM